jgi:polyribonucleotide nucleotidyltransferase
VLNPTYAQLAESVLDLVVAGTKEAITMVEAGANEVPEEVMVEGMLFAQEAVRAQAEAIEGWAAEYGKKKQEIFVESEENPLFLIDLRERYLERVKDAIVSPDRRGRHEALNELRVELTEERTPEEAEQIQAAISVLEKEAFRKLYLEDGKRTDLRAFDEVRPSTAEVGIIPRVHGTGLFTRGETQVLTELALADLGLAQRLDTIEPQTLKRYMHHYNFPPYSTGETGRVGAPRRREIGHGALAERALVPVIPSEEVFPYAMRLVSDVLESNGSSSMASVCGSTLALMDGGVPIKAPVAGVAMGLVKEGDSYVILTDIQGLEDHLGDMDFKVAGTRDGITALQMDMKITGVSAELLREALAQAKKGRLEILEIMREIISGPRTEVSEYAPRVEVLSIPTEKIGLLIGPGGKTINAMQEQFGVNISVEDDGTVYVAGTNGASVKEAAAAITGMSKDVETGEIYTGKVVKTTNFGAFVELVPGRDGLLHISRLAPGRQRVERVEDVVSEGDRIKVRVLEIDKQKRISLEKVED